MVATTAAPRVPSTSLDIASGMPAAERAYSITMHCRPRHRPSVGVRRARAPLSAARLPATPRTPPPPPPRRRAQPLARVGQRSQLPLDAPDAEPTGNAHAIDVVQRASRTL